MNNSQRKDIHNSEVPVVCQACEVRHRGVCGALNGEQLMRLSKHTKRHAISHAAELTTGGRSAERYANIMSGVVKLSKLMADGRQQIVGLQFAPDFVGRPFANADGITVEAATDVRVCSFPRETLEGLMEEEPELEQRLHRQTLRELDEAREWMLTLGRKNAEEKVASFLYLIATHVDPEGQNGTTDITIDLPMKRGDIADFLGLTIETVSRNITKLRKRGVIDVVDRRTVFVADLHRLHSATSQDLSR
ncbi:Crp/Fnr family transcriptional regulator [Pseudahrensia aquimaris]|uniref:Crp/Fnr family transcriptional regulator n=1 Tax=Pseudahrensia aquimaris TaxID=744461 RepID=A0ABW3FJB4_9HYPH